MNSLEVTECSPRSLSSEDRIAWKSVVADCPYSTVFHTPEWIDVLEESFAPEIRVLVARRDGIPVGLFPFFSVPGPYRGHANHSCLRDHDMVYGGPLAAGRRDGVDEAPVLAALLERFEAGPVPPLSYILPPPGFPQGALAGRGYRVSSRLTAVVDLTPAPAEIWSAVHPKTRNMISKARRAGLSVREAWDEEVPLIPEMVAAPFVEAGRRPPSAEFLVRVARRLTGAGLARVLVAIGPSTGRPVAGAIFLRHARTSYYWAGGALAEGYETAASHLVQWAGIEAARADGCIEHDMVMISPASAPGIARFKLRFGARVVPLSSAVRRPFLARVAGRVERTAGLLAAGMGRRA